MSVSLYELSSVAVILGVVGLMLVRAFAASHADSVDVFRKTDAEKR
ncbi:hypothetical protein [Caballeronia sp. TF1N1]|nr:hypothetical protein [Caballeronia sp. TF1N1]